MLDSISTTDFDSDADRALYGLLHTELLIKNRLPIEEDSIINASIEFFNDKSDKVHLSEAYIYKSHLLYNKGNYRDAMMSALLANEIAAEQSDTLRLAKSHELMADIYYETFNLNEAEKHQQIAISYYRDANQNLNYYYALVGLANTYVEAGKHKRSLQFLDSIKFLETAPDATHALKRHYKTAYTYPLYYTEQWVKAKNLILSLIDDDSVESLTYSNIHELGMIYLHEAKPDSARYFLDICEKRRRTLSDSVFCGSLKLQLARYDKNIDSVIYLSNELMELQTKSIWDAFKADVDGANGEYLDNRNELRERTLKEFEYRVIAALIFIVVIVVIGYLSYKNKLYRRDLEISNKFAEIYDLRNRLRCSEDEKDRLTTYVRAGERQMGELSHLVDGLYRRHFKVMDKLCDEYFEKNDSERMRLLLYSEVEKLILDMKSPESMKELTEIVNQYKDGVIGKFKEEFPKSADNDIIFMTLVAAELSPRTICLLMGYKQSNFYAKRSRLKVRIEKSDAQSKELFLTILNSQRK